MGYNKMVYGIRICGFTGRAELEQQTSMKYPRGFTDAMLCGRTSSAGMGTEEMYAELEQQTSMKYPRGFTDAMLCGRTSSAGMGTEEMYAELE